MNPARTPPQPRASVDSSLWRALGVYRVLALGYAAMRFALVYDRYRHPLWAVAVLVGLAVWSGLTISWYRATLFRRRTVGLDLAITVLAVLSTNVVDTSARIQGGELTLPTIWSSSAALAAAITFGWRGGVCGALVVGAADVVERGDVTIVGVHNVVIMALAGTAIGYVSEIGRDAERTMVRAQRLEAATRERQRLARDIHDGVLQVLALVQRRGGEIGGDGAELGRMAAEQELALRSLVNSWHQAAGSAAPEAERDDPGELDLCSLLGKLTTGTLPGTLPTALAVTLPVTLPSGSSSAEPPDDTPIPGPDDTPIPGPLADGPPPAALSTGRIASPRVTLSGPGEPVTLPSHAAHELAAAVAAALDNVRVHGGPGADGRGARAWILVEDEPDAVTVTVRDDGPGLPPGRLEEARAAGRLGVAHSIRGRVAEVGGTVEFFSVPGQGTEVEFRVPRAPAVGPAAGSPAAVRRPTAAH